MRSKEGIEWEMDWLGKARKIKVFTKSEGFEGSGN